MAEELAGRAGRRPWVTDMRLNKAYLYAATGILERADRCIAEIDTSSAPRIPCQPTNQQYIGSSGEMPRQTLASSESATAP